MLYKEQLYLLMYTRGCPMKLLGCAIAMVRLLASLSTMICPRYPMPKRVGAAWILPLLSITSFLPAAAAAVAEDSDRYALLVGINEYAQPSNPAPRVSPLQGPVNDVALMRSLLVANYGFKDDANHIVTLIGPQATRSAIAKAFEAHLIENAKAHPGSIVVLYFSGHGSQANNVVPGDTSWHDTLLAYDSRADGGRDVVDNEIIDWFDRLRQYTPNDTFILDSCHSGDAVKDVGSLVRRQLPPNPTQSPGDGANVRGLSSVGGGNRALTRRHQFTLLSASLSYESSYEGQLETETGPKYHGYFTFYLDQTLRRRPQSTAERAVQDTTTALSTARPHPPSQHPQAAGDTERVMFGVPSDRDDPFIEIVSPPNGRSFKIRAGAIQGLKPGAFLAVYSAEARRLSGETDKIANAQVIQVDVTTSTAELSEEPKLPFTQQARVTIVTPYFGFAPLRVRVSDLLNQNTTNDDHRLLESLAAVLATNKLVAAAKAGEPFDLAVRRGCVSVTGQQQQLVYATAVGEANSPPCSDGVYYLTEAIGDLPLFAFHVSASDPQAPGKLAERAVRRAKWENVHGLKNLNSPMDRKIRIALAKVELDANPTGGPPTIRQVGIPSDQTVTTSTWAVGEHFQIKIANSADQDVYAATLMLGSSGVIELITANPHGDLVRANTSTVLRAPRDVGLPLGIESYKVFATTSPNVDFRTFEQPEGAKSSFSPLEWLLNQTINGTTRDSIPTQGVRIDDWATDSVDIKVEPRK
jgi:hypothetical protein